MKPDEQVSLLERIIEESDLISSRFLPIGASVARAVGRITIRQNGRRFGYGTGFLVSPELLLTNHHVLESSELAVDSFVEFDFFERQDGRTNPTVVHRLKPERFFLNDKDLDYAFVAVASQSDEGFPLTDRGFIHLIAESGKALIGEPVNVIQHPAGNPQQIAIRNNNITDIIDDFLHYAADTERGSSGSPVFNMQWELAALHHSGVPLRNAQGQILMIDGHVFDGRPENEERITWKANEGVRISSIVDNVKSKLSVDSNTDGLELFKEIIRSRSSIVQPVRSKITTTTILEETQFSSLKEEYSDEQLDQLTPQQALARPLGLASSQSRGVPVVSNRLAPLAELSFETAAEHRPARQCAEGTELLSNLVDECCWVGGVWAGREITSAFRNAARAASKECGRLI